MRETDAALIEKARESIRIAHVILAEMKSIPAIRPFMRRSAGTSWLLVLFPGDSINTSQRRKT